MNERYEISKIDIKPIQWTFWVLTGFSILLMVFFLILKFGSGTVLACAIGLVLNGLLQYFNTKSWNVWYQAGKIYFQNIYDTQVYDIELFKRVEMTGISGTNYRIYLNNNRTYDFRIKQIDDLKLLFKSDDQYYAKELTKKLNELK